MVIPDDSLTTAGADVTDEFQLLTPEERRRALRELVLRYGDAREQEYVRTGEHFWVDSQRVVGLVAVALSEEASSGGRGRGGEGVLSEDVEAALTCAVDARAAAELDELCLLHTARVRGLSWERIAALLSSGVAGERTTAEQTWRRYEALRRRHPNDVILRAGSERHDSAAAP
jgi:hypothetical protein